MKNRKEKCSKLKLIVATSIVIICSCVTVNSVKSSTGIISLLRNSCSSLSNSLSRLFTRASSGVSNCLRRALNSARNIICCTSTEDRNERKLKKQLSRLNAEVNAYKNVEGYLKDTAKTLEEKIKDNVLNGRHSPTFELAFKDLIETKVKITKGEKAISDLSALNLILGTNSQD